MGPGAASRRAPCPDGPEASPAAPHNLSAPPALHPAVSRPDRAWCRDRRRAEPLPTAFYRQRSIPTSSSPRPFFTAPGLQIDPEPDARGDEVSVTRFAPPATVYRYGSRSICGIQSFAARLWRGVTIPLQFQPAASSRPALREAFGCPRPYRRDSSPSRRIDRPRNPEEYL